VGEKEGRRLAHREILCRKGGKKRDGPALPRRGNNKGKKETTRCPCDSGADPKGGGGTGCRRPEQGLREKKRGKKGVAAVHRGRGNLASCRAGNRAGRGATCSVRSEREKKEMNSPLSGRWEKNPWKGGGRDLLFGEGKKKMKQSRSSQVAGEGKQA